jgi:KaiC/GvpD/RAD55 family RecA-like ATPase
MGVLDRNLRGGVPTGNLVALVAPPESQSELLLESIATAGQSLYLTNSQSSDAVAETFPGDEQTVGEFDESSVRDGIADLLTDLPEQGYAIFDAAEPFERLEPAAHQAALGEFT